MSSTTAATVDIGAVRRRRPESPDPELDSSEPRRERCPRCSSRDTKFCYYNNYNTSQPRHFCKSCRRYWTLGGSLRNVPVGGSSRKRLRPAAAPPLPQPLSAIPPLPPVEVGFSPLPVGFPSGLGETILDKRSGFDLGLGLGIGPGPLLWPLSLFEEEVVGDTWRLDSGGESFGAASAVWKDVGFSAPVDGGAGGAGAPERKVH